MSTFAVVATVIVFSVVQFGLGIAFERWLRNRRPAPPPEPSPAPEWASAALHQLRYLTTQVTEDVRQHTSQVQGINQGLLDAGALNEEERTNAIQSAGDRILQANSLLQQQLQAAESKLREKELELQQQTEKLEVKTAEARTDVLTGVANRRAFDDELAAQVARWQEQGTPVSLIMVDADYFKRFNDQYGHQAGDATLRRIAFRLTQSMRDVDIVARFGGEEFGVILTGMAAGDAKRAAECVRASIEEDRFEFEGKQLKVTVSIGLATCHRNEDAPALIKRADAALYGAKQGGRNAAFFHDGRFMERITAETLAAAASLLSLDEVQQLIDDSNKPSKDHCDKREHVRNQFSGVQAIAPYVFGPLPAETEFHNVQCLDLSPAGFSFMAPAPTGDKSLVIRFGEAPNFLHVAARVTYQRPVDAETHDQYRIGCQFINRVSDAEYQDIATGAATVTV